MDSFFIQELQRAKNEWMEVQSSALHTNNDDCPLCWAGDGDPRCQRCGISVGGPVGCQCQEGYLRGPCHDE